MSMGSEIILDLAFVLLCGAAAAWLCRRAGLSAVLGYLLAGMLIGPLSPAMPLVVDARRVESLSHLGLVFLLFDIGRQLGWQRLRKLGLPVAFGAALGAWAMFTAGRLIEAVAIAGMVFGMSALSIWAGYSAALGAFLLGSIVGSTRERAELGRFTAGSRDIFGAVFFVAAGMMFDPRELLPIWPLAIVLTVASMLLRWVLIGQRSWWQDSHHEKPTAPAYF